MLWDEDSILVKPFKIAMKNDLQTHYTGDMPFLKIVSARKKPKLFSVN